MKEHTNVTLSLPPPLLRRLRVYAAQRNRSMTALMAEAIGRMLREQDESDRAERRIRERLHNPAGRLPGGKITWSREEIYHR